MTKKEEQLIKRGIDPDLLEISGSMRQYRIDIDNFIKRAIVMLENRKPKRKVRHIMAKKSAKAKK